MFKQQISPRNAHPYQTTVVPRSDAQFRASTQRRAKHPWIEDTAMPVYQAATDSSNSDVYQVPQYDHHTIPRRGNGVASPMYHSPYYDDTGPSYGRPVDADFLHNDAYTLPQCDSSFSSVPLAYITSDARPTSLDQYTEPMGHSPVPPMSVSPADSPTIGGCGGHCPGFEYVCYYILQIIFVVGILTGISLCIAGSVLRKSNRGGDLGVLVYIGMMASSVCGVLLGVQCCVRRDLRRRRQRTALRAHNLQMRTVNECPPIQPAVVLPLLQQSHHHVYRPTTTVDDEVNGIPWWRRQEL